MTPDDVIQEFRWNIPSHLSAGCADWDAAKNALRDTLNAINARGLLYNQEQVVQEIRELLVRMRDPYSDSTLFRLMTNGNTIIEVENWLRKILGL